MKHTIQALVENKFGVLARVASLFSARGFNIDSLAVGETHDPSVSCMTIVVNAEDELILDQIKKQLHKLIDVITVVDMTQKDHISREFILFKIMYKDKGDIEEIEKEGKDCHLVVLETKPDYLILQVFGEPQKVKNFASEMKKFGIKELVRTGVIAISK